VTGLTTDKKKWMLLSIQVLAPGGLVQLHKIHNQATTFQMSLTTLILHSLKGHYAEWISFRVLSHLQRAPQQKKARKLTHWEIQAIIRRKDILCRLAQPAVKNPPNASDKALLSDTSILPFFKKIFIGRRVPSLPLAL
jgi:hypothetical protein